MSKPRRSSKTTTGEPRAKPGLNQLHIKLVIVPISLASEIKPGDSLAGKLLQALRQHKLAFVPGDILVVKHKIVSKAEGRIVDLATIKPSATSIAWAKKYKLDARVIELALHNIELCCEAPVSRHGIMLCPERAFLNLLDAIR